MVKEKGKQTLKINSQIRELDAMLDAVGAHNPSVWLPIIKSVAPFIARIAIRYILRRLGHTTSEGNIENAVTFVRGILTRVGPQGSQSSPKKAKKKS